MTTTSQLNADVSRGEAEFLNVTCAIDGGRVLFPVLPPGGSRGGWNESRCPIPTAVYLRSDGSRINDTREPRHAGPDSSRPNTTEPSAPITDPPQSPHGVASTSAIAHAPMPANNSTLPPMQRIEEPVIPASDGVDSQDYHHIRIIEECAGMAHLASFEWATPPSRTARKV